MRSSSEVATPKWSTEGVEDDGHSSSVRRSCIVMVAASTSLIKVATLGKCDTRRGKKGEVTKYHQGEISLSQCFVVATVTFLGNTSYLSTLYQY